MSEQMNVEARVDELSKPENKAELESLLNSQFNEAINPADNKTAAGNEPETKDVDITDSTPEPKSQEAPSNSDENKTGEGANRGDRVKDLLADRNEAKSAAAEAQTENQILSKQVAELTELVQKLATGKNGEGEDGNEPPSADDLKGKDLKTLIKETLDELNQAKSASESAEKSITEDIQSLENNPETPKAKEYEADIKALMVKHPTISAYMAYVALVGSGKIPSDVISSNANKTGTGNRTKTGLKQTKSASDMTSAEMEAHLRAEEKSGGLQGII